MRDLLWHISREYDVVAGTNSPSSDENEEFGGQMDNSARNPLLAYVQEVRVSRIGSAHLQHDKTNQWPDDEKNRCPDKLRLQSKVLECGGRACGYYCGLHK
jgi:hypothetical protein